MDFEHIPVLPLGAVDALSVRPGGVYVDGTLGGCGHAALVYARLEGSGRLIGIDQDASAIAVAKKRLPGIDIVQDNFHNIKQILSDLNVDKVDGVLLDLGVSSHQLDTPERGFSYRHTGMLDMRMNQDAKLTAHDIVNTYTQEEIANVLFTLGEERHGRRIARAIVTARDHGPIMTTTELAEIIEKATPRRKYGDPHPAMRSFMALRIAVNDELHPLDTALTDIVDCLKPGGRIGVITFHSLEDRIVKQCFNRLQAPCTCPRDIPFCACGKLPQLKVLTKKPILPTPEELELNGRAHSAKLRVGEKIDEKTTQDTTPKKKAKYQPTPKGQ